MDGGRSATHGFSRKDLDALARGGGGREAVLELRSAKRSKLLVTLLTLLESTPSEAGPLGSFAEAWDLLAAAERADPAAVSDVLALPAVHSWAAQALRHLRGSVSSDAPLWFVLGHMNAIAAAAAVSAGLEFRASIPVFAGLAVLPTLGAAVVPTGERHAVAEVVAAQGEVVVRRDSVAVTRWFPMRRVRVEHEGRELVVWLDDLSPFRAFGDPQPAELLSDKAVVDWTSALDRAWRLLVSRHSEQAEELAAGLAALVPKQRGNRFRDSSATSADAFGSVELALPAGAPGLAAVLIHEFAHSKLNGLFDLVTLDVENREEIFYAPWRDDPRPLHGVLHGVYSFLAVTDFWRGEGADDLAYFRFALHRVQTTDAIETIERSGLLTEVGERFIAAMRAYVQGWQHHPVPERHRRAAERVALDHRATWRLRHLAPDPDHVAAVAADWTAGQHWRGDPGPAPELRPADAMTEPRARTHLTEWALRSPETFKTLTEETVTAEVPGATPADLCLVLGETRRAKALYRDQIAADPDGFTGWIGLGLTVGSRCLAEFPELVRAVAAVVDAAPGELVAWFDRG
ncbi:HEXXH motif domain-containing protein [Kutzneria sp. CA-103260]|uniref:HEXXH motif domain-containing protein n=1 Tax=Kutzneria sp. CA-103260 TaxID=2802641 RepID=UPI001BA9BA1F|nr:HEXXH motif domain-containing protein [Kutzneria sp. CA-103260]